MNEHNTATRFDELDEEVKDMLRKLEPENAQTLKYMASIPKDELKSMMKMYRDIKAVSKFFRWMIISIVAVFLATMAVGENILKLIAWLKGGTP